MKPQLWKIPPVQISGEQVDQLYEKLQQRLIEISSRYQRVRFATSLAAEDMVNTDAIARENIKIEIFTLNTGRLHEASIKMYEAVQSHYKIKIHSLEPNQEQVKQFIEHVGLNAFYESEDAKKTCCDIRKVKPLQKALDGAQAWLTGQRKEQSVTRTE